MSIPAGNLPRSNFKVESQVMDKREKRRLRLIQVRDELFGGSAADLGRAIGKDASYVSRMLYPEGKPGRKRIGEESVEVIEKALEWTPGTFDSEISIQEILRSKRLNKGGSVVLLDQSKGIPSAYDDSKTGPRASPETAIPLQYPVDATKNRRIFVIGKAQGGLPERMWSDGDYPVGATDEFAELASADPHAFICPVVGDSMFPRFMPGEYVLVLPSRAPELEDTVLVRLATGETMLKRLLSRRDNHVRLGSWNETEIYTFREEEVTWMYTVAHSVPPWMIKHMT